MLKEIEQTFYEETNKRLINTSQLKLFSMLEDTETKEKMLNIFNVYRINEEVYNAVFYDYYEVQEDDWWENISFRFYGTVHLWWIVALINNVVNPFEALEAGTSIKVLKNKYIYQVLKEIKNIGNL